LAKSGAKGKKLGRKRKLKYSI